MAASTDDSGLDPSKLQQQLEEKDQLVLALTERLEEAAEQLDRAHRSGADKGGRVSGGGPSPEVLTQQQALIDQLSQSVELWGDVQPRDAFARIEDRLDDLRALLENNASSPRHTAAIQAASPSRSAERETQDGKDQKKSQLSAWEQMKAELMETGGAETPTAHRAPAAATSDVPATSPTPESRPRPESTEETALEPLSEMPLPEPIDVDAAERDELAAGIEVRDQYIGYLTRRLRTAESRTHQQIDWESLNNAPEELRETLQQLEAELVDRLRIAEVDLSLERARLSRVETRVRGMQKQIEKRLQSAAGKGPAKTEESTDAKKNGKRPMSWFGSLGR